MSDRYGPGERDVHAVLDSADSEYPVFAPEDRKEAWLLKAAHTFHCSSALGGCGTELTFAIGEINRPHFRHRTGVSCALMGSDSVRDRYTHLAVQNALRDWINGMPGFTCRLEVAVEEGRTDVLSTGADFEAALEVQRSQLTAAAAKERTARYRARAAAVDWLFSWTGIHAYQAELAECGYSLRIWWGWEKQMCRIGVGYYAGEDPEPKEKAAGGPLTDWYLTPSGLDSEHLRKAKHEVAQRREALRRRREDEEAQAADEALDKQNREADARRRAVAEGLARYRSHEAQLRNYSAGAGSQWPATWPVLAGSQKQVYWAAGIRVKVVGFLHEQLAHDWLDPEQCYPVAQWLAEQGTAKFWIDRLSRAQDVIDLLHVYERRR